MSENATSVQHQAIAKLESVCMEDSAFVEVQATIIDPNGIKILLVLLIQPHSLIGYSKAEGKLHPDGYNEDKSVNNEDRPFLKRLYRGRGNVVNLGYSMWDDYEWQTYTYKEAMLALGSGLPGAQLLIDSIKTKSKNCSVKGTELKKLATDAWCEAFGITAPTPAELKKAKAASKETAAEKKSRLETLLRSGTEGIAEWNGKSIEKRRACNLKNLDLSNSNLHGINLYTMDLSESNFSDGEFTDANFQHAKLIGANLNNARIVGADCQFVDAKGASFQNTVLQNTNCSHSSLIGVDFENATIEGVDFTSAVLYGTNFRTAMLKNCVFKFAYFDNETAFPDDFEYLDNLTFNGKGVDPRKVKAFEEAAPNKTLSFDEFFERLKKVTDKDRLKKTLSMLKKDKFQLFSEVRDDSVTGIVKSQTDPELVYSCRLTSTGEFACCTQNLNSCGGLRGALCKHILVLLIGLTNADELDPNSADTWARASALHKSKLDTDLMSEIFLKYKGAEAGEIDWRPVETIPEDFYAF